MLKAAIIGMGVGEAHISGYAKNPDIEVVSLCDFDTKRLDEIKEKYPDKKLTENANKVLYDPEINIISVASYDNFHFDHIIKALNNGKHVFVEKPLCLFTHEAESIRVALRRNPSLKMSSNLILRRCPRFIEIKKRIDEGVMGEIYHLDGAYNYGRTHKITNGWRGKIDFFSGICGGGVHLLDLFLWFSRKKVFEVSAYGNQISTDGSSFKYNDCISAVIKLEDGITGVLSVRLASIMPHFHQLDIWGTKATFVNYPEHGVFYSSQHPNDTPEIINLAYPGACKGDLLNNFIRSITSNIPLEVGTEDIFRVMSVCFAIDNSLKKGKPQRVKYI